MTGCDNFCSYCAVPITRGREKSRPEKEIIYELRGLISKGYKEITLLGQNVNSYKYGFTELLKKIDAIPGDYRVYFYSNHPKDMSDELINLLPKLKHFPRYLHLPLQSGDNDILKNMNRHYTAEQYLDLVAKIKGKIPDVVLTTDIIVGYPGEGEEEFQKTLDVVSEVGFEMIFIGQYSPRAGTISAKMEDSVSKVVKKQRDRIITDMLKDYLERVNKKFVGRTEKVLIDENKAGKYYGRTEGYKVVEVVNRDYPEVIEGSLIKTDQSLEIGRFYTTKITDSSAWKLFGEFCS
jgi:tRNA-2-methylthio-N6-dimethylallyladenosine synthase